MIDLLFSFQDNAKTLDILNAAAASSPANQLLLANNNGGSSNNGDGSSSNGGDTVPGLRAQLRLKEVSVNMMKREVEKLRTEASESRADNEKLLAIVRSVDGMDVEEILRRDQNLHEVGMLTL